MGSFRAVLLFVLFQLLAKIAVRVLGADGSSEVHLLGPGGMEDIIMKFSNTVSSIRVMKRENCFIMASRNQCQCKAMCQARPSCLSEAYNSDRSECRLSSQLPLFNNTETSNTTWLVSFRKIPGTPYSNCSADDDCSAMDGPNHCFKGKCRCKAGFAFHMASCCINPTLGAFSTSLSGEPDPAALLTEASIGPARCRQLCMQTPNCLLLVTETTDSQRPSCALFAGTRATTDYAVDNMNGGKTGEDGTNIELTVNVFPLLKALFDSRRDQAGDTSTEEQADSRTVDIHAFRFDPLPGHNRKRFVEADDGRRFFLYVDEPITAMKGAKRCAKVGSIVFPASSHEDIHMVMTLLDANETQLPGDTTMIHVGLDRFLTNNAHPVHFVSSKAEAVTIHDSKWDFGHPKSEPCVAVNARPDFHLHDVTCRMKLAVACQYVGTSMAAGKTWERDDLNMTVDLGGVYQIYGVRYTGAETLAQAVTVNTSLELGQEMSCTAAPPDMAAPVGLSRLLTCQQVTYGRYVHLHFGQSLDVQEEPSVHGIFVRDLRTAGTWAQSYQMP